MKKLTSLCLLLGALAIGLTGCYKDDINDLKRTQAEQDALIASLQGLQSDMATQINTIHELINNSDGYVTEINPKYGPEETIIGVIISYNNAADKEILFESLGTTPVIGLRYDDGNYYWTVTIDGETEDILVDGEPVIANGPQGETPVISLRPGGDADPDPNNFYWQVTIGDNDPVDILVGGDPVPATGAKGDKGDSWFLGWIDNGDYYSFILNDGAEEGENATLDVVKYKPNGLVLDAPGTYEQNNPATVVPYTYIIPEETLEVFVLQVSSGWSVVADRAAQTLTVGAPNAVDPAGWALLLAVGPNGASYSYVMNLSTLERTFGTVFYDGGVPTGIVVVPNDGTNNSGMVISYVEGGPFYNSTTLSVVTRNAWRKAQDWAETLGTGWELYRTSDYRELYTIALASGGIDALNTALVAEGAPEIKGEPNHYWTGEENTIGTYGKADSFGFFGPAPGTTQDISKTTEGYYARAIKRV